MDRAPHHPDSVEGCIRLSQSSPHGGEKAISRHRPLEQVLTLQSTSPLCCILKMRSVCFF